MYANLQFLWVKLGAKKNFLLNYNHIESWNYKIYKNYGIENFIFKHNWFFLF